MTTGNGFRWNVVFNVGENLIKVIARKGKITVTDEIKQNYQTEKWSKPALMTLNKIAEKNDIATIEVKLFDANKIMCLNSINLVRFGLIGNGQLLDNLGASSGSKKVELQNRRAIIRIKLNGGKNVANIKCEGITSVFCEL